MAATTGILAGVSARLNAAHDWIAPLFLRLILAWEFYESGITKLRGENWFADIPWADWQMGFPWPFSQLPVDVNWFLATWGELVFAPLLLVGLFTRFAAFFLIIITVVATAAVHWPAEWSSLGELWQGYVISSDGEGNFKLPLLFVVMLLPLVFGGGGRLSLDNLLCRLLDCESGPGRTPGLEGLALALAVLGMTLVFVMPLAGFVFLALALASYVVARLRGNDGRHLPGFGDRGVRPQPAIRQATASPARRGTSSESP